MELWKFRGTSPESLDNSKAIDMIAPERQSARAPERQSARAPERQSARAPEPSRDGVRRPPTPLDSRRPSEAASYVPKQSRKTVGCGLPPGRRARSTAGFLALALLASLALLPAAPAEAQSLPAPTTVSASAGKGQVTLTWSAVTGATTYQYRYKVTAKADTTYTTPADVSSTEFAARSKVITGLAPVGYTFQVRANGASGSWASATATPTTTVYNTDKARAGSSQAFLAQAFTTGANAAGYNLDRVYVAFDDHSDNDSATTAVKVRNSKTTGCGTGVTVCPGDTVLATLTREGSAALRGVQQFDVAAGTVVLDPSTVYFLTLGEGVTASLALVDSTSDTGQAGDAGWSIGDAGLVRASESSAYSRYTAVFKIAVSATQSGSLRLSADQVTHEGARLTIANHSSTWYHKGTHSGATCSTAVTTTTDNLSGLSPSTSYTYKAYSDSTCTTEVTTNATDAEFTTLAAPRLTHSALTHNSVTLTIANHSGNWYHKGTHSGATCSTGITTTTDNLTGLSPSTSYTYKAYSNSTCATEVTTNATDAEFTTLATPRLTHSALTHNSVTLTIANYTGTWHHKGTHSGASCSTGITTTTDNLSGLSPSTPYTYKAYSDSTCTTELTTNATDAEFTTLATPATPTLTHTNVTHNSATLTIANHTTAWWYRQTVPSTGTCTPRSSTQRTASLVGLAVGTTYTYKAFSDSACTTEIASTTFTTVGPPATPTNLRAQAGDGQVTLSWYSAARATGYQVQSKALAAGACGSGGYGGWTNVGGGTRHTVGGLANRTRYCFRVRATNAAGESAASSPAAATPRAPVQYTVTMAGDYYAVNEGDRVAIVVTLSEPPGRHVAIPLKVTRGTAEPEDVGDAPVVDIWGGIPGRRSASGHIWTYRDDDTDDDTFTVSFGDLPDGVEAGDRRHWGVTIRDTGGPPDEHKFRVSDADAHEPESLYHPQYLHFEVTLAPASEHEAGVDYSTREGTAREWWDYEEHVRGRLTFRPGETSKTVRVNTADDADDEGCETMFLDLAHPHGAVIADGEGIGYIHDDPPAAAGVAWLFPSASGSGRRGVVRVVNRSDFGGEVAITATDDAGRSYPPLTLTLAAGTTAHFDSRDLELGNPRVGLAGATGPGMGDWRLEFDSDALDIEVLAHVYAADGFVVALDATVPADSGGALRVPFFSAADDLDGRSLLRLVNPGVAAVRVVVIGVDDAGHAPGQPVLLAVPAGAACTVDAAQLESGQGLACGLAQAGLGDGAGRWRLKVAADAPLVAMNLLTAPDGRLSNLSGVAAADADGVRRVPLFPSAADPRGRQGVVRVINRAPRAGTMLVAASDGSGAAYPALTLRLEAGEAVELDANDLELGSQAKGLSGSTGPGTGTWQLALSADVPFEAPAYLRGADGFLTAMPAQSAATGTAAATPAAPKTGVAGSVRATRTVRTCAVAPEPEPEPEPPAERDPVDGTCGPIRYASFGGSGGDTGFAVPVSLAGPVEVRIHGGKFLDAVEVNGIRYGNASGGSPSATLTVGAGNYITHVEARAGGFVDYLSFTSNGTRIAAGGSGGTPHTLSNIRLLSIEGRYGDFIDSLKLGYCVPQ